MKPLFWAALAFAALTTGSVAQDKTPPAKPIVVTGQDPLDGPFLGLGVGWDSTAYGHYKIGDQDFEVIKQRLEWMRPAMVRTMMMANWCYLGDDRYDFETPAMQMLYKQLDLCEKLGIKVALTEWGLNDTWLKCPGLKEVDDPKYPEVVATYFNHLLNVKKYTCIQYFIFVNEPEEWPKQKKHLNLNNEQAREMWKTAYKGMLAAFEKHKIRDRLIASGPDQSGNRIDWLEDVSRTESRHFDAYEIHLYANQLRAYPTTRQAADSGLIREFLSNAWQTVRQNDPDKKKPLFLGEAGLTITRSEMKESGLQFKREATLNHDWRYGIYMTQFAIQSVEAGTWGVLAWMLDDSSHQDFTWGLWTNKAEGSGLKPWFYTWSLFTRVFPTNSKFSLLEGLPDAVEGISAHLPATTTSPSPGWSFVLVNTGDHTVSSRLSLPKDSSTALVRYLYVEKDSKVDANGLPIPVETLDVRAGSELDVSLPPRSVTFIVPASLAASK